MFWKKEQCWFCESLCGELWDALPSWKFFQLSDLVNCHTAICKYLNFLTAPVRHCYVRLREELHMNCLILLSLVLSKLSIKVSPSVNYNKSLKKSVLTCDFTFLADFFFSLFCFFWAGCSSSDADSSAFTYKSKARSFFQRTCWRCLGFRGLESVIQTFYYLMNCVLTTLIDCQKNTIWQWLDYETT